MSQVIPYHPKHCFILPVNQLTATLSCSTEWMLFFTFAWLTLVVRFLFFVWLSAFNEYCWNLLSRAVTLAFPTRLIIPYNPARIKAKVLCNCVSFSFLILCPERLIPLSNQSVWPTFHTAFGATLLGLLNSDSPVLKLTLAAYGGVKSLCFHIKQGSSDYRRGSFVLLP